MPVQYTISNESITVVWEGKPHVVQKGSPHFAGLRDAILSEKWDDIPNHLTVAKTLASWAKGKFALDEGREIFSYEGRELPQTINRRIIAMATAGEDPTRMFRFFERLNKNPSMRSVEQLYPFLEHQNIPITPDGCFLAYKGVNANYTDHHTGTIDNKPGVINKLPRNQISDDPREACHFGFHVGARGHAQGYGNRMIVCKVDPEHVVCVPYDSGQQKMRVCEYTVVGNYGDDLPSTVYDEADLPPDAPEEPAAEASPEDSEPEAVHEDFEEDEKEEQEDEGKLFDTEKGEVVPEESSVEPVKTAGGLEIPKKYAARAAKPVDELMQMSLDDLRELATYGLKIIGASKIRGGKSTLVARIVEVRGTAVKE